MINTHVEETENQLNTTSQKVHYKPPCHTASLKKRLSQSPAECGKTFWTSGEKSFQKVEVST